MTNGAKFALASVGALVLAAGIEILYIHHRNAKDAAEPTTTAISTEPKLSEDDAVFLKKQRPDSLKDERTLIGKTIWVSAAGQMNYYRATGKHADYQHPVGTLQGAEPLIIKDVFEQIPPNIPSALNRLTAGSRHVLLAFTMPKSSDPKTLYAAPVGHFVDGQYEFLTDEIFFYDDPHILYKHWGDATWALVDKHEVAKGMTENQVMMSIGQISRPHGDKPGDRSVTYDNNDHPIDITFVNGKATRIGNRD